MSRPIVHIVDDDESFLRSMSRLLKTAGYSVATFARVEDFLNRPERSAPGCVLTDLQMPKINGLDLQKAVGRSDNPLPIVFITSKGDIPTTVRALRSGAEDFLTKQARKAELIDAVERALKRDQEERKVRQRKTESRGRLESLTFREREVLSGVIRGQLNKQIAADLKLSERTVKLHRTTLTAKLGVHSPAELALMVNSTGLTAAQLAPWRGR